MISHLIKICLSLMLATSLMAPRTWCCTDSGQTALTSTAPQHTCCFPQPAQQDQPSEPVAPPHNCSCYATNTFADAAKTPKVDPIQMSLHLIDTRQELIPPGKTQSVYHQSPLPHSRPLHLMHCVWTC
ncbi:hypothetical protein [uncultured Gimesia sp.]|uniref:hypothetical protein n=1 Tax=uncultured Gimesia sp. TaxID=1678688 RepID=UPI0030DD47A9